MYSNSVRSKQQLDRFENMRLVVGNQHANLVPVS